MLKKWKETFNPKQFSLKEDEPEIFVKSQWQTSNKPCIIYLIYRLLIAFYFLITWLLSILIVKKKTDNYQIKWLIYLTNWGYSCCTFQACIVAFMLSVCVLAYRLKSCVSFKDYVLNRIYKIYWFSNTIATVTACAITIIYWTLIYNKTKELDAMNIFVHAFNSIVMIFDFWIVSHPVRIAHCVYPMIFGTIYAIFSVIYYLSGGTSRDGTTYIYPILKWENPLKSVLVCVGVAAFLFIIHFFYFIMYLIKRKLCEKLGRIKSIELNCVVQEVKSPDGGYINEGMIVGDQV